MFFAAANIIIICFLTPVLTKAFIRVSEWLQVFPGLQDSSKFPRWFLLGFSLSLISSSSTFPGSWEYLPRPPTTTGITATFMFHSLLSSLVRSGYLFSFVHVLARFPVDKPSHPVVFVLVFLLSKFAAFTYHGINRFISITIEPTATILNHQILLRWGWFLWHYLVLLLIEIPFLFSGFPFVAMSWSAHVYCL